MANPQVSTSPVAITYVAYSNQPNPLTTAPLVGPSVSSENGESVGMNTTNIVQSNLTRKVPYSNYSVNFDGTSDLINFGNVDSLKLGSGDFTWSGWIHPYSWGSSWEAIYTCAATNGVWIGIDDASNFVLRRVNVSNIIAYSTLPTVNTWTNICITRVSGACTLYYNGISVATGTSTHNFNVSADVRLGSYSTGSPANFNGIISNVSIFDSALTQDDVINLYNNGITQDLNNFRLTPTAWFPLDQSYTYFNGSVLVARDVISGNDGTGVNIIQENIVGSAPGSEGSGTGQNIELDDLKGNMYNSNNNAYSINMADYADGVTNPANSGRSTDTPS